MTRTLRPLTSGLLASTSLLGAALVAGSSSGASARRFPQQFPNPSGVSTTLSMGAPIDRAHPFFQALGTNGRSCGTCHDPAAGWSITPQVAQARFDATAGEDPLFRPVDGANSPTADMSSVDARRAACSLLLNRGLIRVSLPMPQNAEFTLESIADPYGYATVGGLSLYRRPLPATNLRFLATVMWDGRETHAGATLAQNLASQAQSAHQGHAQAAAPLTDDQAQSIVAFESAQLTAQTRDQGARALDGGGGHGGPLSLLRQPFHLGMNPPFKSGQINHKFDPRIFRLFGAWSSLAKNRQDPQATRRSVARGQKLFNSLRFLIRDVPGLNDALGQPAISGTCGTCHNTPNVGSRSVDGTMDIGIEDGFLPGADDLPKYTLRNAATGETRTVTDPGRALVTGRWADVAGFKVPSLRGLAARAPYFHDGSAATLEDVVTFYDSRFGLGLGPQQVEDLANFLRSL